MGFIIPSQLPQHTLEQVNKINIEALRDRGQLLRRGEPGYKAQVRNEAYLDEGATVLGRRNIVRGMGVAINAITLTSGLIDDYEVYKRAKANGVSIQEQLQRENHMKKYIITPFGVMPNNCSGGLGVCIQDPNIYE